MAKAKTPNGKHLPTLFDVFDYYDEKGELQNDVLNPSNRPRKQEKDRGLLQRQGQISRSSQNSQGKIPSESRGAGSIPSQSEGGGIRRIWGFDNTRGDMGSGSKQAGKSASADSSQSTDRVLFRPQDMGGDRKRMAEHESVSKSAGERNAKFIDNGGELSSVDSSHSSAMGKKPISKSNTNSRLQQADLFSRAAISSGDGGIYAGVFSSKHSESDSLSSSGGNGSEPESILSSMAREKEQPKSQSQQHMGYFNERAQRESSRGGLLGGEPDAQIPNFSDTRKTGESPSLISDEEQLDIGENYRLNDSIAIKGLRDRFEANIAAIATLRALQANDKMPSEEQKEVLSKFSGFGGMAKIINSGLNGDYAKEYETICKIVDNKEDLDRLERSCSDSYYTPKFIIDSIYNGLKHFGLDNDSNTKHIYEPSCGNGRFIGYMPKSNYKIHGTELDKVTYGIAKLLYPQANLENMAFERVKFNRNFDAFIGNPPYGDKDTGNANGEGKICDFFMLNSIENLKDDGIAAFVVSSRFLDKSSESIRAKIAKEATFIGAIRLPNNVFRDTNAEVTSDIVFFKKGLDNSINQEWIKSKLVGKGDIKLNEYFWNHKEHILGELCLVDTKFGKKLSVMDNGKDLPSEIDKIISVLPKDIYQYHEPIFKYKSSYLNKEAPQYEDLKKYISNLKSGSLCIIDGSVYQVADINGRLRSPERNYTDKEVEKIKGFIAIRDTFNELVALEQSNIADNDINLIAKRAELNQAYDRFVKEYGYLSSSRNIALYRNIDPESNKITALEKQYDKGIGKETAKKMV